MGTTELSLSRPRKSNMELLRIVAMSMILIHHFFLHAIYQADFGSAASKIIFPFFQYGVDIFFLISGWFQIRLSVRSLLKLILSVYIFMIISVLCFRWGGGNLEFSYLLKLLFFPISEGNYWFIAAYLGLMVVSPMLNHGLDSLNGQQLRAVMTVYTIFTVYSCGLGHNICNSNGSTFGQAIYLYCVAHWIRMEQEYLSRYPRKMFLILAMILSAVSALLFYMTGTLSVIANNSALTISVSALLLIYFSRLKISSLFVNKLASAAFGCYLIQDGVLGGLVYPWQHHIAETSPLYVSISFFAMCFVAIWAASYLVTPVSNKLSSILIGYLPQKVKNSLVP